MSGKEHKTEPRETMSGLRDTTLELRFTDADGNEKDAAPFPSMVVIYGREAHNDEQKGD